MIQLNELKRIAAKQKIALGIVEKDYSLTWVLYGLSKSFLINIQRNLE